MGLPAPVAVEANAKGVPTAVLVRGVLRAVVAVSDHWRTDDEWWRAEISRRYFSVDLEGGTRLTVFHDLISGEWYRQQTTPTGRAKAG